MQMGLIQESTSRKTRSFLDLKVKLEPFRLLHQSVARHPDLMSHKITIFK